MELYLEELLDQLLFIWNYPVSAYKMELLDLTPPVSPGDIRRMALVSDYRSPKFRQSKFHLRDPIIGGRLSTYDALPEPIHAALRWYSLGVQRQPDVQRFIAFWVSLETLIRHVQERVQLPYKAPCGHEIPHCPECNKSTSRDIGGAQITNFLIERGGLPERTAKALWRTRQLVHGQNRLRPNDVAKIPDQVGTLWIVLRRVLAIHMGIQASDEIQAPVAISEIYLEGTREIDKNDLNEGLRTFPKFSKPWIRVEIPTHFDPNLVNDSNPNPELTIPTMQTPNND